MNIYKTGKRIKFEDVDQAKEADFFKKSSFCRDCICGGRCLGNRLDTVAPSLPIRNEGMYSSVTDIFEQYYLEKSNRQSEGQVYDS